MSKTIRPITASITVTGGSGSLSTSSDNSFRPARNAGGVMAQTLVKGPTGITKNQPFDFKITDANGFVVFDRIGATLKINDTTPFVLIGTHTIEIENADKNGDYSILLYLFERW